MKPGPEKYAWTILYLAEADPGAVMDAITAQFVADYCEVPQEDVERHLKRAREKLKTT